MRTLLFLGFLMSITGVNFAQSRFSVQINADTVGLNNGAFQVYFTVENAQKVKNFHSPTFEGFEVQGPSQTNSTIVNNGEMRQEVSYIFYLTPQAVGTFPIGKASIEIDGEVIESDSKDIVVVEEYERQQQGFSQNPFGNFGNGFGNSFQMPNMMDMFGDFGDSFFQLLQPKNPTQKPQEKNKQRGDEEENGEKKKYKTKQI